MITDSFFHQGETHEVCEDYALHGENYAIVSDGCSNAGGPRLHTDWGSRILCKAAEENINTQYPFQFMNEVIETAEMMVSGFRTLPPDCLTATLLVAKSGEKGFHLFAMGDGFFGGRKKDGSWVIKQIEFPSGAPFYLQYIIEDNVNGYVERFGDEFNVIHYGSTPEQETIQSKEKLDLKNPFLSLYFPAEVFDTVFVASDGMASFLETVETPTSKHTDPVKATDAFNVILDILEYRPGFLRLQRNWAFKQKRKGTYLSRNWRPSDDVSIGMISNP